METVIVRENDLPQILDEADLAIRKPRTAVVELNDRLITVKVREVISDELRT